MVTMSERYTIKDAREVTKRLAAALDKPYGHYVVVDEEPGSFTGERTEGRFKSLNRDSGKWFTTQPGALEVDYNPVYGGCVISEIAPNGGTWVSEPFKRERLGPREFCQYVNGVISGIYVGRGE